MVTFAKVGRGFVVYIFPILVCIFILSTSVQAQTLEKGNLMGSIYDRDGKTPIPGAVLKVKNITSGSIYESTVTDRLGVFKIDGLSKGIYTYGITTSLGDFNSNELIGILARETTRISIALNPYESSVQSAAQEILREQTAKEGEARIGRVVQYNPQTKEAQVFIEKGLLALNDRTRILGVSTNFYQDCGSLILEGSKVRTALAGQSPLMGVKGPVEVGDTVYAVCKTGTPFFLTPCGLAWVVAGSGAILAGIITTTENDSVSPTKK